MDGPSRLAEAEAQDAHGRSVRQRRVSGSPVFTPIERTSWCIRSERMEAGARADGARYGRARNECVRDVVIRGQAVASRRGWTTVDKVSFAVGGQETGANQRVPSCHLAICSGGDRTHAHNSKACTGLGRRSDGASMDR